MQAQCTVRSATITRSTPRNISAACEPVVHESQQSFQVGSRCSTAQVSAEMSIRIHICGQQLLLDVRTLALFVVSQAALISEVVEAMLVVEQRLADVHRHLVMLAGGCQ